MEYIPTILNQMVVMALYMLIGFILHATNLMSKEGNRCLSNLLLYIILPCVVINSFLRDSNEETTKALLIAFVLGALLLSLSMLISGIVFRKNPIDNFSASFSNAGFMGIPLITAILGSDYVIYAAGMVALLNLLQWFYGHSVLDKEHNEKRSFKPMLKNPFIISLLIGIVLYFIPITLPQQISSCVKAISNCNAPIAMFIVGYYLKEISFREALSLKGAYIVSAFRLLIIPLLSILLVFWMSWIRSEVKIALIILASAPVGSNVAIYVQRLGQDYPRAVTEVCLSTLLSLITMPIMLAFATILCR